MKHIILIILTILLLCGSVYGNPAVDILEQEIDRIRDRKVKDIDGLKKMAKYREIIRSIQQQERDNEVIRQWEKDQREAPCNSLFQGKFDCKKVNI